MDSSGGNQEMGSQTLESMLVCTRVPAHQQEKKPRPADEQALKCPRCDSANTKFCYYNNYSLSQPRYFCKSCRRYWTKGGTLRNVPVGGGCRKNKRPSSSSSSSSSSAANKIRNGQENSILPMSVNPNPLIPLSSSTPPLSSSYDHHSSCNDLSLAIARLHKQSALGFDQEHDHHHFAMWANNSNPNLSGEVLGMNNDSSNAHVNTSLGLFDALGSGDGALLHHQHAPSSGGNGNFYGSLIMGMIGQDHHHHHHHQMGSVESIGGIGIIQDSGIECDREYGGGVTMASTAVTTLKQEIGSRSNDQNRVLWGFPWQVNGDGDVGNNQSIAWNGIGSGNNWHGLLNSPLM